MEYSKDEILQYMEEEDVKFIRLAFCDVFGRQKNISVMPEELPRAFRYGIAFDASAIAGFGDESRSDLLLHPEPETLTVLPWRPEHGRVVRMIASVTHPDGTPLESDPRHILKQAMAEAKRAGYEFCFGAEQEFYLFRLDADGRPTKLPCDEAGYMDIAPEDRGENVRREVCLTLEQMGIRPESSHHEEGCGQNEIDFRYADPLTAADNAVMFRSVVRTIAAQNGLWADFSPRPLAEHDGNGMHINISARRDGEELSPLRLVPGLMRRIPEMTRLLNPVENSYARLGRDKAPAYITWSEENRSQLVRVPAAAGEYKRVELRSPDNAANPYLAFTLMIHACLEGVEEGTPLPEPTNLNLFRADASKLRIYDRLPSSLGEATALASRSAFLRSHIPAQVLAGYGGK